MINKELRVFYAYSHVDESLRNELEVHLTLLRRKGEICGWHDRKILPGSDISPVISEALNTSDIILLLVSPDFLASDYCYDVEMQRALELHRAGEAVIIPIIIRPVDFSDAPFATLLALPTDAKPVTTWANRDEAWLDVARGIRAVCENIRSIRKTVSRKAPDEADSLPTLEPQESDLGIVDFNAELEVAIQVAVACQTAMGEYTTDLTDKFKARIQEVLELQASTFPNKASKLRMIAGSVAAELAAYAKRLENTSAELGAAWDRVDRYFPKFLDAMDIEKERENAPGLRAAMNSARDSLIDARTTAQSTKQSVADLGKLSGALRLGTARAQKGLQEIAEQYWRMENSIQQMLSLIDNRFGHT
jgi:hypothetical protein